MPKPSLLAPFFLLSAPLLFASACALLDQPAAESDDDEEEAVDCEVDAHCRPEAFCSNGRCIGRPSPTGGAGGLGGSAGTGAVPASGGADATGGSTPTGGGPPAGGAPPTIVACPSSISTGVTTCTNPCAGSTCGLGDLGRRDCVCTAGVYRCASCQFPGAQPVTQEPAGTLPACTGDVGDNVVCALEGDRCMLGAEVCACLQETSSTRWDCDDPPWGRPPCPATLPANASGCGVTRYSCVYGAVYCSCEASGLWACG